jgi:hypothetical protein
MGEQTLETKAGNLFKPWWNMEAKGLAPRRLLRK